MKVKKCPACGHLNEPDEIICQVCMTNIAGVKEEYIQDQDKTEIINNQDKTQIVRSSFLILSTSKFSIKIESEAIIGRHYEGAEYLRDYPTVSRKHARVFFMNGDWYIEDLESTNGTFLNGRRITPIQPYKLSKGDKIKLSNSLELTVDITDQ